VIVVDGRTDEEKVLELLAAGAEETTLDGKASLDLSGKVRRTPSSSPRTHLDAQPPNRSFSSSTATLQPSLCSSAHQP